MKRVYRSLSGCALVVIALCFFSPAIGRSVDATDVPAAVGAIGSSRPEFFPVSELTRQANVKAEVHKATAVDPRDWPASFYGYIESSKEWCTATLVADKVLLTAAHCVPNGEKVKIAGQEASCESSPAFDMTQQGITADYALCLLRDSIPGVPFERVNADPAFLKMGQDLKLTGFGCTDPGEGSGTFRVGDVKVAALPSGSGNSIAVDGASAACFGDSGGGTFAIDAHGKRVEVSVNSRFQAQYSTISRSFLASTSTDTARRLFDKWHGAGHPICGVHPDASGCR